MMQKGYGGGYEFPISDANRKEYLINKCLNRSVKVLMDILELDNTKLCRKARNRVMELRHILDDIDACNCSDTAWDAIFFGERWQKLEKKRKKKLKE